MKPRKVQKLAENEVFFRQYNETIQKGFDHLTKIAEREGEEPYAYDSETPLYFYCECSDEDCRERVFISLSAYNDIHKDRDSFIVVPGHEVAEIEHVVVRKPEYHVVRKFIPTPRDAEKVNPTDVDNV